MNSCLSPTRRGFLSSAAAATVTGLIAPSGLLAAENRIGRRAPAWDISEWINQDAGNVDALRGKVVVIDFFQLWCPGCNQFS